MAAPSTFTRFNDLPLELRLDIWSLANEASSLLDGADKAAVIFSADHSKHDSPPPLTAAPPSPNLQLACQEAHSALTSPAATTTAASRTRRRPFNPSHDILIVPHPALEFLPAALKLYRKEDGGPPPARLGTTWLPHVHHLAIQLPTVGYKEFLRLALLLESMDHLPRLSTVSLILPRVPYFEVKTAPTPEEDGVPVRELVQDEKEEEEGREETSETSATTGGELFWYRRLEGAALRRHVASLEHWEDHSGEVGSEELWEWVMGGEEYVERMGRKVGDIIARAEGWNSGQEALLRVAFRACFVGRVPGGESVH